MIINKKGNYNNYSLYEKSIIIYIFYSKLFTIYICKYGEKLHTFQKILDILILISIENKKYDLYDLINNFFVIESEFIKCKIIVEYQKY